MRLKVFLRKICSVTLILILVLTMMPTLTFADAGGIPKTKPDYAWGDYVQVSINGGKARDVYPEYGDFELKVSREFAINLEEITVIEIDTASVLNPTAGKSFSDKIIDIPVSDDRYTVSGYWVDEEGNREGTFTKGNSYFFLYTALPKAGYCFSDSVWVDAGDSGVREQSYAKVEGSIRVSLLTQVDEIVLTGVPKPKVGATLQGGEFSIKVPAGANYTAWGTWYENENPIEGVITVKEGIKYELKVEVVVAKGYEFASKCVVSFNGSREMQSGGWEYLAFWHTFEQAIPKVEIEELPPMQIGKEAKLGISVPEDAPYIAEASWAVWNDKEEAFQAFSGTFEKGQTYEMMLQVYPKDGFCFNEKTRLYIDGEERTPDRVTPYSLTYGKSYPEPQPEPASRPEETQKDTTPEAVVPKKEETENETPETGDHNNLMLWIALLAASGAGITAGRGLKKGANKE